MPSKATIRSSGVVVVQRPHRYSNIYLKHPVCIWCLSLCRFALVFPDLTTCYRAKGVWDLGYVFNLLLSLFIKKYVGKTVFVKYISVLMK